MNVGQKHLSTPVDGLEVANHQRAVNQTSKELHNFRFVSWC